MNRSTMDTLILTQRTIRSLITNGQTVNPKSGNEVREALLQFFAANSETRTNLLALIDPQGDAAGPYRRYRGTCELSPRACVVG